MACWAHTRRKFYEAQSSDLMRSTVLLAYIRLLYDVERDAREQNLDSQGRLELRQAHSVPILDDIAAYLKREQPHVLPKSPEGQAIAYALSNWEALVRYCQDGDFEIDNNGAERSLRGVAVGRRNWTFFGSDNGGRSAVSLATWVRRTRTAVRADDQELRGLVYSPKSPEPSKGKAPVSNAPGTDILN